MVPDRQKVWTGEQRQNYIPPTLSGDNKLGRGPIGDATYQIFKPM